MRQLMNLMNLVKRKRGVAGLSKKIRDIFFESGSGTLILGSLMFICFINSGFVGTCRVSGYFWSLFNEPYEYL